MIKSNTENMLFRLTACGQLRLSYAGERVHGAMVGGGSKKCISTLELKHGSKFSKRLGAKTTKKGILWSPPPKVINGKFCTISKNEGSGTGRYLVNTNEKDSNKKERFNGNE